MFGSIYAEYGFDEDNRWMVAIALKVSVLSSGIGLPKTWGYQASLRKFVFESRLGDRFYLGSSVWRLEKIEKDRVIVSPSNASGAKIPFWIGDQVLRSVQTGRKLGQFIELLEKKYDQGDFFEFMQRECGMDRTASENLRTYIADQLAATGCMPGASRIICEHFSDEPVTDGSLYILPSAAGSMRLWR